MAMRADELIEAGNMETVAVWKRIERAIDKLLAKKRLGSATVH